MAWARLAWDLPRSIYGLGWHELRHNRRLGLLFFSGGLLHALAHGLTAFCAANLARSLTGVRISWPLVGALAPHSYAFIGLGTVFIKGVAGWLAVWTQSRLAGSAAETLRNGVIGKLLGQGLTGSSPQTVSRLVSRLREAEQAMQEGVLASVRALAQLLPLLAALGLVSARLTLASVLLVLPFALGLSFLRKRWRRLHESSLRSADELHEELDDLVRHAELWRTHGTALHVQGLIARLGARSTSQRSQSEALRTGLSSFNELLGALALALALWGASWHNLALADGSLLAFCTVVFMAYRPLRDLGDARSWVSRGQEALETLAQLASSAAPAEAAEVPVPMAEEPLQQTLIAEGFGVPGKSPSLTFVVPAGSMVAIAGPTGAGKTTLLRALLGLEPQASGSLFYGKRPLLPGQVGPQYRPFAWVPQDAPVVSGTLDDNFRLAGVNQAQAQAKLLTLGAASLRGVLSNVKVGQGGRPLSGGERRWVALARALATGLPVLLLDEPTVGLDPQARKRLLDLLAALRGKRSLIVVSHNAEVLGMADQVVDLSVQPTQLTVH